jgi:uncharacterized protein DUF4242
MPLIMLESVFDPPISESDFDAQAMKVAPCLDERHARWVTSYMSLDRRRRICVFEALDAEAVREAYRMSGVKFERAWVAEQITGEED